MNSVFHPGTAGQDDLFSAPTSPVPPASTAAETAGTPVAATGPLAHRMRPLTLDEVAGHEKVLARGKPLRTWIESDRLPSLVLWGPPGCGKTSLARVIAENTRSRFESLSAVLSGVKDIKEAIERARGWQARGHRTLLFVDEIHRFNKSQQDALLPHVEQGLVTLIGATTENPSFELNSALLSRARVIRLEPLSIESIEKLLKRALADRERGLGGLLSLADDAVRFIAETSEGDARRALTALETASYLLSHSEAGAGRVRSLDEVRTALESAMDRQPIPYDKDGEEHHNVVSAFIKSMRDSHADGAIYYLARMLEGGEDPLFICRRMVIFASEDVGNADPRALQIALAAKDAVDFVGMPEARINLAQAVTYLACAPKSNASYVAINEAIAEVRRSGALPVPMNLRNAPTTLMKREGYAAGYRYAHDDARGAANQPHLPKEIAARKFYEPKDIGYERNFRPGRVAPGQSSDFAQTRAPGPAKD